MAPNEEDIRKLAEVARSLGAKSFSYQGVTIRFAELIPIPGGNRQGDLSPRSEAVRGEPAGLSASPSGSPLDSPQSLDEELSFEKILNWSAPPDPGAPEPEMETVPMTGDVPLNDTPIQLPGEATPQTAVTP